MQEKLNREIIRDYETGRKIFKVKEKRKEEEEEEKKKDAGRDAWGDTKPEHPCSNHVKYCGLSFLEAHTHIPAPWLNLPHKPPLLSKGDDNSYRDVLERPEYGSIFGAAAPRDLVANRHEHLRPRYALGLTKGIASSLAPLP